MDGKRPLVGLLLGMAVGAALGLMYAPRAGRETREQLAETAAKAKEALRERAKSAPLIFVVPIAFQYQHQDQIHHHYPKADDEAS